AVLPVGRPADRREAAAPLRHVAGGPRAGPRRPRAGRARGALADLLARPEGPGRPGPRPRGRRIRPGPVGRPAGGPSHPGPAASARWVPAVAHDDPLLASAYAAARVVALPSWFETPGLAALEGALAGRAVVVTPYGCAPEYFGDMAVYVRPGRPTKLAQALSR